MLGIDEIGVQIEEPFGLLPLDDICDEIEGDLFCMLREAVSIKRTAMQASIAAGTVLEEWSAVPYSPLPRVKPMKEFENGNEHKEWSEVTGRTDDNGDDDNGPCDNEHY